MCVPWLQADEYASRDEQARVRHPLQYFPWAAFRAIGTARQQHRHQSLPLLENRLVSFRICFCRADGFQKRIRLAPGIALNLPFGGAGLVISVLRSFERLGNERAAGKVGRETGRNFLQKIGIQDLSGFRQAGRYGYTLIYRFNV